MPQQILVISPGNEIIQSLCESLRSGGFVLFSSSTLVRPSTRQHQPALCIIDLHFSREDRGQWERWLEDCRATRTACLAFDSSEQVDHNSVACLEPLCDVLVDPQDFGLLIGKVHSLLTIRKLTRQLDATRLQLSRFQLELQDALHSAANIQQSLIPTRLPNCGKLSYSWQYLPCKQVGGDLFNVVQLDEQTVMAYLMDVSGHGISSAMVTVSVHQSLSPNTGQLVKKPTEHPPYYAITSPRQVLRALESEYPFERFEEFFTISYLLINPYTGQLRYSNGGHPPPFLLRKNGSIERLDAGGTLIGVGSLVDFEEGGTDLKSGDRIFLYTDGITEHQDAAGTVYGEARFCELLLALKERPLEEVTRNALVALREFGGSSLPSDDVTLIGIEFKE